MAIPEYEDPTQPKEVGQVEAEPKEVEAEVPAKEPSGDEAEQTLDEFTKGIDGSKFSNFDDLLEYVVLLNELPDTKSDMESSKYDLRNTRFMRALKIFIEYLNANNWFAVWDDGEVYPLGIEGASKDKAAKFDPKTKRAAFNPEWYSKLYTAVLKFFTAAPGLSEDFVPQFGTNAGKVTKSGNRSKYIKQHLGQVERIAQKRGEERAFTKMVSWLHNIYLAGSGLGTSRYEYQDPYKYLYDSREAEGLYIYETKEEAIASLIGVDVSRKAMTKIMENHKKNVWMGISEGYNDLPPELDPREDQQSGYGKIGHEDDITASDLPPRAKMTHHDLTPVNDYLDGQACESCGCNPCGCEAPASDIPDTVTFMVQPEPKMQPEVDSDGFGPCPMCGKQKCGCVDENMAMGNTAFLDDEMDECMTDVQPDLEVNEECPMEELQSKKVTEIKGTENESSKLDKTTPKLKGGVKKEGGSAGLEGGKKPAPKPPASV